MYNVIMYSDPFYYTTFSEIIGRGGFSHIHKEFTNTRTNFNNMLSLKCFTINRIDNISLLVTYWILVQAMFIALLWKELIIFITFVISLFMKYGLIYFYKNCWLKYIKPKNNINDADSIELVRFNTANN